MAFIGDKPDPERFVQLWILLILAFLVVVLRCLSRIQTVGLRHLKLDDWLVKVSVVSTENSRSTSTTPSDQSLTTDIVCLFDIMLSLDVHDDAHRSDRQPK